MHLQDSVVFENADDKWLVKTFSMQHKTAVHHPQRNLMQSTHRTQDTGDVCTFTVILGDMEACNLQQVSLRRMCSNYLCIYSLVTPDNNNTFHSPLVTESFTLPVVCLVPLYLG